MLDLTKRYGFVIVAVAFETSLIAFAAALAWWFQIDSLSTLSFDFRGALWGVAGTGPMIALFLAGSRFPVGPLRTIKELLLELLGPSLAACRWYDLLLVATVAGFSEELLFRGVLQPLLGLIWSNVLFGLAHAVTVSYAVLAGLIGGYLGWMLSASGNLLAPIIAHALYDFLAFLAVAREWRQSAAGSLQDPP